MKTKYKCLILSSRKVRLLLLGEDFSSVQGKYYKGEWMLIIASHIDSFLALRFSESTLKSSSSFTGLSGNKDNIPGYRGITRSVLRATGSDPAHYCGISKLSLQKTSHACSDTQLPPLWYHIHISFLSSSGSACLLLPPSPQNVSGKNYCHCLKFRSLSCFFEEF